MKPSSRETRAPRAADIPVPERGQELADRLAEAGGEGVVGVLMYGSHLNRASPGKASAYDFAVVVEDYGAFHSSLRAGGEIHRPLALFNVAARVLPPSVIAFAPEDGRVGIAKCLVVRRDHFRAALSSRPKDHFLAGRMIQKVALPWFRTPGDEHWIQSALDTAHGAILEWMAPYVEGSFTPEEFGRRILEVCYQGEIRPEAGDRSRTIFESQAEYFRAMLHGVFHDAVQDGVLEPTGEGRLRYRERATARVRRYWRRHFRRSKARATARWFKHIVTFDNWLPYMTGKVERRTGQTVELNRLERAVPIVFLWPRVIRVLLRRPDEE